MSNIYKVADFNKMQDENWNKYLAKCEANNVKPQDRNRFNQFIKFDYKAGFVMDGNYPIYKRRKRDLI